MTRKSLKSQVFLLFFVGFFLFSCAANKLPLLETVVEQPRLHSRSAVLIEYHDSRILFQKEKDLEIAPASMAKAFLFYLVLEGIEQRCFDFDTKVAIGKNADWKSQPKHSSLMFLEEGDIVTVDELLCGLMLPSGNDAAAALATLIGSTLSKGVEKMNELSQSLSLVATHFADASGFSEFSRTTAYEFALFTLHLWKKFPDEVEKYSTLKEFAYPKEKNIPQGRGTTIGKVVQQNHNETVNRLSGVIGLKTGYIGASGANVALIYQNGATKFVAVLMGSPGETNAERSLNRAIDATNLLAWGYNNFKGVDLKAPSGITILEKKSGDYFDIFSIGLNSKTFTVSDAQRLEFEYKVKPSFKLKNSKLPQAVGWWKINLDGRTCASGNLFVEQKK